MDEKHDGDANADRGRPGLGQETDTLSVSFTGSSTEIDEKRQHAEQEHKHGASGSDKKGRLSAERHGDAASAYGSRSSHSTARGESDMENEEIEDTVPGRVLDRELSRVGQASVSS
jgi:hypothetical protein